VLALARDGSVWAWGEGGDGRLGVGALPVIKFKTHTPASMKYLVFPMRIPGLSDVAAISAGGEHSLALLKDGTVLAWGGNKYGQLGDGTTTDRSTPVPVQGLRKAISICAGSLNSFAVQEDGAVFAWGSNDGGALGRPGNGGPNPVPRPVPGVAGARAVSGSGTGLVLTQGGTLIAWGFNGHGETGRGTTTGTTPVPPAPVKGLSGVRWMRMRDGAGIAVLDDGRIFNWGGVRPWVALDGRTRFWSASPVLLSVDGLDNP
jgi:alpha-tubulin suppressor-like RCC1 family protein